MARINYIVYTASFDRPVYHRSMIKNCVMVCVSDKKPPQPWIWIKVDPPDNRRLKAREVKILPWIYFGNDWDQCIWFDSNFIIKDLPAPKSDIAIHKHSTRNCIYKEASICIKEKMVTDEQISRQMERYEGFPKNYGLWETGALYRKNTHKIKEFSEDWWYELEIGTPRDQISLPVMINKHNIRVESLGNNVYCSKWCRYVRR